LESDQYRVRQQATRDLARVGIHGIAQLTEQIILGGPEAASRCSRILTQIALASDEADMTRIARIMWMLSHNGFDHLRAESIMLSEKWKQSQIQRTVRKIRDAGITIQEMPVYDGGFGGRVVIRESFDTPERPDIGFSDPDEDSTATESMPAIDRDELLQRVGEIVATDDDQTRDRFTEEIANTTTHSVPTTDEGMVRSDEVVVIDGRMVAIGRDGAAVLLNDGQQQAYTVTIDDRFEGSVEALELLRLLPSLQQITISEREIDASLMEALRELPTTHQMTIANCRFDLEQMLVFMRARRDMTVTAAGHQAFLGVTLENSSGADGSVCIVSSVVDGTAAAEAGLQVGDVIEKFNGSAVFTFQELIVAIGSRQPGDTVQLDVIRDEELLDVEATLKERPAGQ
ncbi:MAG: PDZ domain-containing protein, partial [Pirellulaceae bacterium]